MNSLKNLLPLSAAIISAMALLGGYAYQKKPGKGRRDTQNETGNLLSFNQ